METILVVDDEKNYLIVMSALLSEQGYEVLTAENGLQAMEIIENSDLDLVLTDMKMPQLDGIELLKRIHQFKPEQPVIVMTAFGTVEKAVQAMKAGAFDYITKPFQNEELMLTIQKALDMYKLVRDNKALTQELRQRYQFENIIGKTKVMQDIFRMIEKVADTQANVLITGESGTGKELIARAIHQGNHIRRDKRFTTINCAALPENLLESELFGHEKGAFTGAVSSRKGRFEISHGGTLFLDEIGDMSLPLQAKLLRVIQEREFERLGGNKTIKVDVRLVAASNQNLKQETIEKRFREDLLYRLNVIHLHIPPLRERTDDIPLLVNHFIHMYSKKSDRSDLTVSPEAMRLIFAYHWPGNVRELENVIERAVILCANQIIHPEDLPEDLTNGGDTRFPGSVELDEIDKFIPARLGLNEALESIEKKMIERALKRANNVQAHAASLLGIKKNVMQYKLKKYNLL
ncbi:MAG: sigma-54-dependent Fis family transcriptional regulator [Deltaproteobacteria bacterium]|nr:sigma-54-dependent Fis family transcriptional regulator [Deltaproteobacteria bacterium]MBW2051696.1 sigma-54-dependent Fis family transcriptional regulator [Deltaproteobacteria bacterium]MBW2139976.1 sigma-54-dependent Fis family transcriptional regulator [Deltaproteobacteria bacterium]MBW2322316.1 sigma-54-dependent Fis family transcriptional regulator [Deltaproteobacteria bacterium]